MTSEPENHQNITGHKTTMEKARSTLQRWNNTHLKPFVDWLVLPDALTATRSCPQHLSHILVDIDHWRLSDITLKKHLILLCYELADFKKQLEEFKFVLKAIYPP